MPDKRIDKILLGITMLTLTVSLVTLTIFSGYNQTPAKFKTMLVTLCLVLLLHYMLIDPIKLVFAAIGAACWSPRDNKFPTDKEASHRNRLHYLKVQLRSLRYQLWITEEHRDERNNSRLKLISTDLILFGKYLFMVVYIMVLIRDVHEYYVAHNIKHLLNRNDSLYYGLKEVRYICDVYDFIQTSFIDAFSPSPDRNDLVEWVHGEQTVLVGVLRLRQLRLTRRHYGVRDASFSKEKYLPEWKLPYRQDPYMNSYWRIYKPWLPMEPDSFQIPLIDSNSAFYRRYSDLEGYVTYLARTRQNSQTILNYLREYKWLDYNTSVLFLDFSLFNTDTNVFIICTIRLEQTPFGSIVPYVDIVSLKLLGTLYDMDNFNLVLLFLYVLVLMEFCKAFILRLWFDPKELYNKWNKVDLVIILLNLILLVSFLIRKSVIESILEEIKAESKMRYIDTGFALKIHNFIKLVMGFLIALTTIRLWKVLQFSPRFQLFSYTLLISWKSVVNMAVAICVLITGYALAFSIVNGNNSYIYYRFGRSIVASTCYIFGFSKYDIFHDDEIFGIISYAFLTLLIFVIFLNIIISLINYYFTIAKTQGESHMVYGTISIFQFWRAEFQYAFQWFQKYRIFRKTYHPHGKTVMENIIYEMAKLKRIQRSLQVNHLLIKLTITRAESKMEHSKFKQEKEKIFTLGAIMNTQIDILERYLHSDKNGNLLEEYSNYDKNK